jgi:hypothetical protein
LTQEYYSHRQMSMPKPVCPNMATATPLGSPGPRRRRSSTPGRSRWTRSHLPPEPSSRGRGAEGLCLGAASLHSGHLRGIGPPNRGPGRTLIPGDGATGDQRARNRPACPAVAATRRLRTIPVSPSSWRYDLRRTCRLVTGRSHLPRSTWPDQARLPLLTVTHRYKRAHRLWLEQFQIAEYCDCL